MAATIDALAARGINAEEPTSPDGSDDVLTTWIVARRQPALVQWPAGHLDGISAADWAD